MFGRVATEQCASATIEEISQKISGVRRFYARRDVGLFRRTAPCAAVHLAVRQMGPPFFNIRGTDI
jgi:hypothetical protein